MPGHSKRFGHPELFGGSGLFCPFPFDVLENHHRGQYAPADDVGLDAGIDQQQAAGEEQDAD
jgi:hypothetical protein